MGKLAKKVGLRAFSLARRMRAPEGIPVLAYHSVDASGSYLSTAPAIFAEEMACLSELGYRGVSMAAMMAVLDAGGPLPADLVVLTFDDGLSNFMCEAWPVIRRTGFSATLYVPTDFVGGVSAWFADYRLTPMPCLAWEDLRRLRDEGADIQSHGCSHRHLTALAPDEVVRELRESRDRLGSELGAAVDHFSYPFGDFNAAVKRAVRDCGYRSAVTTTLGRFRATDDPYEIHRKGLDYVDIPDASTARLVMKACMTGAYAPYIRTKLALGRLVGKRPAGSRPT